MQTQAFFSGFVKLHILHHASVGPIFGLEMMKELARHGYDISPGTLYPALHRLEREGLICSEARVMDGHVRKYYTVTSEGKAVLDSVKPKLKELVGEILADEYIAEMEKGSL